LDAGDPNVNIIHVVEPRRKTLKVRDGYLDALWELRQARADLAAAVGDPALAVVSWTTESKPTPAPPAGK